MRRYFLKACFLGLLAVVTIGFLVSIEYYRSRASGDVRGLTEYNLWEYNMIKENPDYDDLKILIDIAEKKLYLLNGNQLIKKYSIASGKLSTPSPLGSWQVVSKNRMGSGFGTRWMGLNVPWSTYQREYGCG